MTSLSVVIPTLDEARRLPLLLDDLEALSDLVVETLVVDGGSTDGTDAIARDHGARVIAAPRGRGVQLLAGGTAARGHWIFFVHADCRLPPEAAEALRAFVSTASECEFAHFAFELEGRGGVYCEDCSISPTIEEAASPIGVMAWAVDEAAADRLWALSEEWAGETFPV